MRYLVTRWRRDMPWPAPHPGFDEWDENGPTGRYVAADEHYVPDDPPGETVDPDIDELRSPPPLSMAEAGPLLPRPSRDYPDGDRAEQIAYEAQSLLGALHEAPSQAMQRKLVLRVDWLYGEENIPVESEQAAITARLEIETLFKGFTFSNWRLVQIDFAEREKPLT
jgi:hypothetical protein